ncbi:hypothetical protein LXL04_012522 [Taraxacum kok-saghyz]
MEKEAGRGDKTVFWWEDWSGNSVLKEMFPLLYKIEKEKQCLVKNRIKQQGDTRTYEWSWRKENLSTEEEVERVCCELILQDTPISETNDKWVWKLEPNGEFSVNSLRKNWEDENLPALHYIHWWNNWVPLKVNFLGWRAALNKLPVKYELQKRQVELPNYCCGFCTGELETCAHLFLHCPWAKKVWRGVESWSKTELENINNIEHLLSYTAQQSLSNRDKKTRHAVIMVTLWSIWKARNEQIFNGKTIPPWRLTEEIKSQSDLWIKNRGPSEHTNLESWLTFPFTVH